MGRCFGVWLALAALGWLGCEKGNMGEPCASSSDCRAGLACLGEGTPTCQRCAAAELCAKEGRCTPRDGGCVAGTHEDCKNAAICTADGKCLAQEGVCVAKLRSTGDPDSMEGGCPCGCDRSVAMTEALGELPVAEARAEILRSLHTIGEREAAGYITEAMVQHRLRLLKVANTIETDRGVLTKPERSPAALRASERRTRSPRQVGSTLSVGNELLVFGATTETVNGRDKKLPACFRWWLSLENVTDADVRVEEPTIDGSVTFDARRWYLEDGNGEPWDGVLKAKSEVRVLLIGYLDKPIAPRTRVDAKLAIQSLTVASTVDALGHWDESLRDRAR